MERIGNGIATMLIVLVLAACSGTKAPSTSDRSTAPPSGDANVAPGDTPAKAPGDAPANVAPGDAPAKAPNDAAGETRVTCCKQCAGSAGRDAAGMDISTKDCRSYAGEWNGQPGVDERCVAHFTERRTMVGDCWKEQPGLK